jgi:hypothetical protein
MRTATTPLFALLATASAWAQGGLSSGWEDGQPHGNADQVIYSKDVAGYFNTMSPAPECSRRVGEAQHGGSGSLMIAGWSRAAYAYCYYRLFEQDIPVSAGTRLRYWIRHQGTAKVSVDGHFSDGSTLRDGGFADQHGTSLHPGRRADPVGDWHYVEVNLSAAAGKTLDFVMIGFDNGGDGFTGPYRAYVDDFAITTESGLGVRLRAMNGQWVVAEGAGGGAVNANRDGAGPWETFGLVDLDGGSLEHGDAVRFRTWNGVHYLIAFPDGRLLATSANPGGWETFAVERRAGGGAVREGDTIGLRSAHGYYVVAEGGGGGVVNADRGGFGPWEEFRIHAAPGSRLGGAHPSPLVGRLRLDGNRCFVDDTGPVLPIVCHFGEAFSRYTRDRDSVRRQLDVVAQAGYHGIRFWTVLTGSYWSGREVNEAWTPDYWGQLRDFLRDLEARRLRAVISQGGTNPADIPDRYGFAQRLSTVLDETGTANVVAIIEGANESWQTGEADPNRLAQFVGWIKQRHPACLYTISAPPGEGADELNAWSVWPADLFDVHGYRGGRWWDKVRHIFSIPYEGQPQKRLGWQGEPCGPGEAVSVTENKHELDDDTLAAMCAMSLMARQAWCYMSGPGVLFDSPIDAQPGFWTVPRMRDAVYRDVMGFSRLIHGGSRWADERVFEAVGETRCDQALSDDGRFVALIYGPSLTYTQVRPATIERVTELGGKARIIMGRR